LESTLGGIKLCVAVGKEGTMTIEPGVFEMPVERLGNSRRGDAGDELCSVEAGEE
jgi:hypothetical protein